MVARRPSKRGTSIRRNRNGNAATKPRRNISKNAPNTSRLARSTNRSRAGGSSGMFRGNSTQVQILSGYDFISSVVLPVNVNDTNAVILDIPTTPSALSGTRWAQLSAMYEKYRFLKATMVYVPSVSSVVGAQMISYWELDPSDSFGASGNLQSDLRVAMAHQNAKLHNIYDNTSVDMPLRAGINDFFVERATAGNDNPRWTQQARFRMIASSGVTGFYDTASTMIGAGSVYLAWTCKFLNPQIQPSLVVAPANSNFVARTYASGSTNGANVAIVPYKPSMVDAVWNRPGATLDNTAQPYIVSSTVSKVRYFDASTGDLREASFTAGRGPSANTDGDFRLKYATTFLDTPNYPGGEKTVFINDMPAIRQQAFYIIRGPSIPDSEMPNWFNATIRVVVLTNATIYSVVAVEMCVLITKFANGEVHMGPALFDPTAPSFPSIANPTWSPGHSNTGGKASELVEEASMCSAYGLPELLVEMRDGVLAVVQVVEAVSELATALTNPVRMGFYIIRSILSLFNGTPKAFDIPQLLL